VGRGGREKTGAIRFSPAKGLGREAQKTVGWGGKEENKQDLNTAKKREKRVSFVDKCGAEK